MREPLNNNKHVQQTTVVVRTAAGQYNDSELIDCAFYGLGVGESSGTPIISPIGPTTANSSDYQGHD